MGETDERDTLYDVPSMEERNRRACVKYHVACNAQSDVMGQTDGQRTLYNQFSRGRRSVPASLRCEIVCNARSDDDMCRFRPLPFNFSIFLANVSSIGYTRTASAAT